MYKQENLSPTSSKNWVTVFIILIGLMITTVSINAQTITKKTSFNSESVEDYVIEQLKEGFKSPNGVSLLYCYSVNLNQLSDRTYRVRRDSPSGINYSSTIEMDNAVNQFLSAKNN